MKPKEVPAVRKTKPPVRKTKPLSNQELHDALLRHGVEVLTEEALESLIPPSYRTNFVDPDEVSEDFAKSLLMLAEVAGMLESVRYLEPSKRKKAQA